MKMYNSLGPNPRCVRIFMEEKGIKLDTIEIDLLAAENRQAPYTDKNPGGQMPALELDDGSILAETTAICEYLEDKHPSPALIGSTPEEKAETRMWQRRIELQITEHMYNGFRYAEGLDLFKTRMHCLPEAAAGLKEIVQEKLTWLDGLMEGKQFIAGDRFTLVTQNVDDLHERGGARRGIDSETQPDDDGHRDPEHDRPQLDGGGHRCHQHATQHGAEEDSCPTHGELLECL